MSSRVVHLDDGDDQRWSDPVRGTLTFRTLLGGPGSPDAFTVGVTTLEPGEWLGRHRHDPAEVYVVLEGRGVVEVDGVEHRVEAGSVVEIGAGCEHAVRADGPGRLRFVHVFAVAPFDRVVYRFSDDR